MARLIDLDHLLESMRNLVNELEDDIETIWAVPIVKSIIEGIKEEPIVCTQECKHEEDDGK